MAGVSDRTKLIVKQALKEGTTGKSICNVNEHNESDDAFSTFDDSDADKNYVCDDSRSSSSTDESRDYENTKRKKRKLQPDIVKEIENTDTNEHIMKVVSYEKNTNNKETTSDVTEEEKNEQHTKNSETTITTVVKEIENTDTNEHIMKVVSYEKNTNNKETTSDVTEEEKNEQHTKNSETTITTVVTEEGYNQKHAKKQKTKRLSQAEKTNRDKSKHSMRNKCNAKCKRDCEKLTEENRQEIWNNYWSLDYTSRRKWLSKHVKLVPVKRKLASATHHRSESRKFSLPLLDFTEISVCRLTFLNTLGYTNDSVITELVSAIKRAPCGSMVKECRGIKPKPKADRELIRNHIESYHPCVSHYRRLNAPNVRYLPRELTVKEMYTNFNIKHPGVCKIEIYRQVLKQMNISLCTPKSDICEQCQILQNQLGSTMDKDELTIAQDEIIMCDLNNHRLKAEKANREYKKDAEEAAAKTDNSTRIYSMDLQKVMLLPMMPQVKKSFFISRLVVFNETFATLNKNSHQKSYCVVWHEALAGRKAEALTDSILRDIFEERDVKNFIFWADNCTGQNKNWVLFTALISEVNRPTGPDEIRIRYLTKGHTHMSADGIHGNIENKIGRKRNIYDFKELVEVITTSRTNVHVLELMKFRLWKNEKRVTSKNNNDTMKGFVINPLVEVKFSKGSRYMKYKTDFDEDFKEVDFLKKKHTIPHNPNPIETRGVTAIKKQTILNELVPLMPLNRKLFWESLPDSVASLDLVNSEQILDIN